MEIVKKRQFNEIVLGFFLLSHPTPVLFHIIAVTLFALLAAWPHFQWDILVLVIAAHAAMQISIAMINDYCDRDLDAASKSSKPLSRGLVKPREALVAGLIMMGVMLLLLLPLPLPALLISLCYLVLGQAYNLGLKSTPWSGIVFALAMPLIPLYAFAGVGHILPVLFGLVPVGFMLGVALNLANSLPDIEDDAANGVRSLAVVLGARRSLFTCQLLVTSAALLIAVLTISGIVPAMTWLILATVLFTLLAVGMPAFLLESKKFIQSRKLYFYLITILCLVLVGGWFIGVLL